MAAGGQPKFLVANSEVTMSEHHEKLVISAPSDDTEFLEFLKANGIREFVSRNPFGADIALVATVLSISASTLQIISIAVERWPKRKGVSVRIDGDEHLLDKDIIVKIKKRT